MGCLDHEVFLKNSSPSCDLVCVFLSVCSKGVCRLTRVTGINSENVPSPSPAGACLSLCTLIAVECRNCRAVSDVFEECLDVALDIEVRCFVNAGGDVGGLVGLLKLQ